MAKLAFIDGKFAGRTYEIAAQRTTVGRSDINTLSIQDRSVSDRHCEIYDNGADVIVRDLGSRNGTTVNGELLRDAQRPLAHGQVVKFGAIEARLEIATPTASDTVTGVTAVHYQARQPAPKPSAPPVATLEAGVAPFDSGEHTIMLLRATPATEPLPTPTAPPVKSQLNSAWVTSIVVITLVIVGWLLWRG